MTKRNKITYWISTLWLVLGMLSTGGVQVLQGKEGQGGADMIAHLGYPMYVLTILGIWKVLGAIALIIPKYPLLKEWTYAGLFFAMTGAAYSHLATGDSTTAALPSLLLLALTAISWHFRPADRKVVSAAQ